MDVNGTPFHLVLGREDWLGASTHAEPADAIAWHEPDHTLRLAQIPFEVPEREGNRRLRLDDRRAADIDRHGHVYWIGADHDRILVQLAGTREAEVLWPVDDPCVPPPAEDFAEEDPTEPVPQRLAGLAVTHDHHLVVGAPDLPAVLVFDLHGGGAPMVVDWPAPFEPFELSACVDGGLWVLDGDRLEPGTTRMWRLDARFGVQDLAGVGPPRPPVAHFTAIDGGDEVGHALGVPSPIGSPLELTTGHAIASVSLPDGSVAVLDRGAGEGARIARYDVSGEVGVPLPVELPGGEPLDLAYLPDDDDEGVAGTVYLADQQGDQSVAFALSPDGAELTRLIRYLPMRLFSGKALVAGHMRVFYDLDDWWLPLADRQQPRYRSAATLVLGHVDGDGVPFDGDEPGTVWHRLALDGRLPSGTSVRVEARAADDRAGLLAAPWRDQPRPYRRDGESEVAYHRFGRRDDARAGTFELLFQRAVGRFLQVRLTLTGDGRRTPALWALRAHAPRFSYLDAYLPAVYREDADSAAFLDRYLANVEGLFTSMEGRIEHAQVLLRSDTLDTEHLAWLASWLGIAFDQGWEEPRVRLLLEHAVSLYGRRGTRRAIIEAIRLATDRHPDHGIFGRGGQSVFGVRIIEAFRTRSLPGVWLGDPSDVSGPRLVPDDERWTPGQGRAELDRRYRAHLTERYGSADGVGRAWDRFVTAAPDGGFGEPFPPLTPTGEVEERDRARFLTEDVGVTYADVRPQDLEAWRRYLVHKHRRVGVLNAAWGRTGRSRLSSFGQVSLPSGSVPNADGQLRDWLGFVAAHLPARAASHRFTVLVPVSADDGDDAREDRLERVRQVVTAERPAHTEFEVRPYLAAFRVGEARLGLDTLLGQGSRFTAIVLGEHRLARGHVTRRRPWNVPDRFVVGRERVPSLPRHRRTTDE